MAYPLSLIREANRRIDLDLVKVSAPWRRWSPCCWPSWPPNRSAAGWSALPTSPNASPPAILSARIQEGSSDEIAHVASALDKTARKLEEGFRALENSRQTLETLLNSMQEAVIAVAQDGRVLWANQRMERLLPSGVRLGAPLVQSVRDPEILRSVQTALEHPRRDGGARGQDFLRPHLRCHRRAHARGRRRGGVARPDRD